MNRLTERIDDSNNYCGYEVENAKYKELFNLDNNEEIEFYVDCDLTLAIDKLGKLEDIEEDIKLPLDVVYKMNKSGLWTQVVCYDGYDEELTHYKITTLRYNGGWVIEIRYSEDCKSHYIKPADYKKTWWLKKDKSE